MSPGQRIVGKRSSHLSLLSDDKYLEDDLVALRIKDPNQAEDDTQVEPRLCVVRPDGGVHPLCTREDDVENDLYIDPRLLVADDICDEDIVGTYGEGWYSQRPVPSLGGGPGYGADADPVWSIDDELVEKLGEEGIDVPVLDVGIAHGEKARGGAF